MPRRLLPALLLLLVPLVLVGPVLVRGERFLPLVPTVLEPLASEQPAEAEAARATTNWVQSDRLFPVLTDQRAMRAALVDGELPLWSSALGIGLPLAAGSIAGPLYPPNALAFAVEPERAAGPLAALTLVLAGLGLWLFLGRVGLGTGPRVVAVLALQLGSWAVGNLYYPMKVDAALWVPFSLWALEGLAKGRRSAGAVLALTTAASFLAGFPTVAVFGVFLVAAYGFARLTPLVSWLAPVQDADDAPRHGPPPVLPPLVAAALAGALGVGLALVQLLPTLEASGESRRTSPTADVLETQAVPTGAFLGLVLHDLVAPPTDPTPPGKHAIAWWLTPASQVERGTNANQLEWNSFVGVGVVALALIGVLCGGRRARFPAAALVVVLGYAAAWPLVRWSYGLPGLNVGAPTRVLAMAWFLWPWLAGLGVQALVDGGARARRLLVGVAVLATLVLGGWALLFDAERWQAAWEERMVERYVDTPGFTETEESIRERISMEEQLRQAEHLRGSVRTAGAAALGLLAASLLVVRRRTRRWSWGPVALVVLVEGLVAADGHVGGIPPEAGPTFPETASIAALREATGDGRLLRLDTSESGLAHVVDLARPNLPHGYGLGDLTPYTVFTPTKLVELFQAIDPELYDDTYLTFNATLRRLEHVDHPILDRLRVTAIVSRDPLEHERLEPVLERPEFHVYRRTGAFPPARVYQSAVSTNSNATVLEELHDPRVVDALIASTALLGHEHGRVTLPVERSSTEPWTPGTLRFERPASGVVEVDVRGSSGGMLVVFDQWYPGWRARLDGERVPILRVDHALRGVALPPGDHVVRMEYAPTSLRYGALLSGLSLLAVCVLLRRPA